jgi:molybdopterin converting factor small subunit
MEVRVKLMSLFEEYQKGYPDGRVTLEEGATVLDLVQQLGIPEKLVRIFTVNGKQGNLQTGLSEGDTIFLFPPAFGGG